MITRETRPRLASKARLRWDRHTNSYLLLYPESGLILNATASDILLRCRGDQTVGSIIDALVCRYRRAGENPGKEHVSACSGRAGENEDKGGVLAPPGHGKKARPTGKEPVSAGSGHGKKARPTGQEPAPAGSGREGEIAPGDREGEVVGEMAPGDGQGEIAGEIGKEHVSACSGRAGENADIERDVGFFLQAMITRGLVHEEF